MKSFLAAMIVAVIGAVGASFVLDRYQAPVETAFATTGARIDKPGSH